MKKYVKKMLVFALAAVFGTGVLASSAEAATLNWHLRYVKGAPSTENIYSWSTTVYTKSTTATMRVSSMNGNSDVYLSIIGDNGKTYAAGALNTNGSISGKMGKNVKIYGSAKLVNYGKGNINPSGRLVY